MLILQWSLILEKQCYITSSSRYNCMVIKFKGLDDEVAYLQFNVKWKGPQLLGFKVCAVSEKDRW